MSVGVPESQHEDEYECVDNCTFDTLHMAVKKVPFVVITGSSDDLQTIISETGDLSHKIIVDATERYGADEGDLLEFGPNTSVVRIVSIDPSGTLHYCYFYI